MHQQPVSDDTLLIRPISGVATAATVADKTAYSLSPLYIRWEFRLRDTQFKANYQRRRRRFTRRRHSIHSMMQEDSDVFSGAARRSAHSLQNDAHHDKTKDTTHPTSDRIRPKSFANTSHAAVLLLWLMYAECVVNSSWLGLYLIYMPHEHEWRVNLFIYLSNYARCDGNNNNKRMICFPGWAKQTNNLARTKRQTKCERDQSWRKTETDWNAQTAERAERRGSKRNETKTSENSKRLCCQLNIF